MVAIINQAHQVISQYMDGFLLTHPELKRLEQAPIITVKEPSANCVPLISGGGSGHEPMHVGFVGKGMLTAAVYGEVFLPPTAEEVLCAIRYVDRGEGVFVIVKNFEADLLSFQRAIHQARAEGIRVKYIVSHDDISVDTKKNFQKRHRGLAGTILLHKILGAAAQSGLPLDDLEQLALSLSTEMATIGFATSSAHFPQLASPFFELNEDQISYGIGIHGEEGYRTVSFESSEQLANEIVNKLKLRFRWQEGEEFILLVNNLGTMSELEQGVFLNDICQLLDVEGLRLPFIKTGRFATSLDMAGLSVTLCRIKDRTWLNYLQANTTAPAW
ncbi:DhaKLM operon coactivator DhaQ [Streptococcus acidominimus]|uniref:DhaKLM operon coactivator DhaQ n=1 Tax=Streptococcus acidominimus TaxID=1326 RepID=A0A4Y9FPK9_STRAI|nr:DhaKLM operon coactivator DhaQ [Streptococcus acidominimus]MBF0819192.1 DhaKLM operon coactivator DhaQ [Streptococcus acidominimus]MBF0837815.1 DhaKLM operon coactivator DhaQ [Streptococcus acidominimus]MBF0847950.1 DhaKLM operon coactivator DhaQ [Streptococcus danieliae]TFU30198.1 DhaKLM operon coactivator DhaQ [Streptococcus acidominimus]